MMKKGYSLAEVMFGLLIGVMLSGIFFESLTSINKVFARVVATSSWQRQIAFMQQQFENDFSGMSVTPSKEQLEPEDIEKEGEKKDSEKNKKEQEEKEKSTFKSFIFEGTTSGLVNIMTFITTNPLLSYRQPSARVVRVAYRVVPDPENQGKFLLVRQQSEELVLKKFEAATKKETIKPGQVPIRSYEMVRGIESIKFEFFIEKIKKQEPDKNKKPQAADTKQTKEEGKKEEESPRVFVSIEEWLKLSDEEKDQFETPQFPAFIHITLSGNDERKKIRTADFWFSPFYGLTPFVNKEAVTELPNPDQLRQRELADEHTQRLYGYNLPPAGGAR